MAEGYKRKTIFIKRVFQGKLIFSTLFFFCGGCLMFFAILAIFSSNLLFAPHSGHLPSTGLTPVNTILNLITAHWVPMAIGGIMLVVSSILLSHRIAGPLYRFERALDAMNRGYLGEQITLRENDEGKHLAEKINSTAALDALLDQVEALELTNEEKETLASLCWSMREQNRRIKDAFSGYNF
jgi:methyl-accepting chemotaxis protein